MTSAVTRVVNAIRHSGNVVRCAAETIQREKQLGAIGLLWRGAAWMAAYLLSRWLLATDLSPVWARIPIALMPAPFFAWFAWHWMRMVQRMDELERRIQFEALAFAFPLTVVWLMTLGLLLLAAPESERVFDKQQVWAMMPLFYAAGVWRAHRHYR